MSVFKTTFSRALPVFPSDTANIPSPTVIATRINTDIGGKQLIDNAATFVTNNVKEGDIVYNLTVSTAATVVGVLDENTLELNVDIFTTTPQQYAVYQASSQTGLGNTGCYLYIGNTGGGANAVTVTTIGGDFLTFNGLTNGTILPVQVTALFASTTASQIIALW